MKLLIVARREWTVRVRTRGFIAFTLGIPVLAAGFLFLEYRIVQAGRSASGHIAVVDLSRQVYPQLVQENARPGGGQPALRLQLADATPATLPAVEARLRRQVLDRALDGYLVIPAGVLATGRADYHTRNAAAVAVRANLLAQLRAAVSRARMAADGLSPGQIAALSGGVRLRQFQVSARGGRTDNRSAATVAMALAVILYVFLLLYGVVVMRSVTEEKTTRISEVLLAAVDPFSLMMGKILGVVSVALTQLLIWAVVLVLAAGNGAFTSRVVGVNLAAAMPRIPGALIASSMLFFLLGFLLYASLYAAIGAIVSSDQEAQQTQVPLTMLLVLSVYLAFMVMNNPGSPLSVTLSLVPFFAPILMVVRLAVSHPPLWQVGLAMLLCALTFLGFTQVTAKLYRVGILMTGKRPSLPELLRWLRHA